MDSLLEYAAIITKEQYRIFYVQFGTQFGPYVSQKYTLIYLHPRTLIKKSSAPRPLSAWNPFSGVSWNSNLFLAHIFTNNLLYY